MTPTESVAGTTRRSASAPGLLVCPACRGELEAGTARARCACGREYAIEDGIPVLLVDSSDARGPSGRVVRA